MLASIDPSLGDIIVTLLAAAGPQDAAQLQRALLKVGKPYTIQAIYYELRKLLRQGVVVKERMRFSIRIAWALELATLSERIHATGVAGAAGAQIVPERGETRSWRFSNLLRLDDFWVESMQLVFDQSGAEVLHNWAPRPWFYFAQAKKLEQFYRSLVRRGRRITLVLGGSDPLDRLFSSRMSPNLFTIRHDPSFFPSYSRQHLQVVGDFILKVSISQVTMREIHALFSTTRNLDTLDWGRMQRVLNASTKARLEISNSPVKAEKLRRKFQRYFGPLR
jgi:hypothetical protein